MHPKFRIISATLSAVAIAFVLGTATAQTNTNQIALTAKQVEAYVAVHKKIAAARAELESLAKAHGFTSLGEYDDVGVNIFLVFDGLDPKSKAFAEPPSQIKKRMEEVKTDKSMSEADKKQVLEDLSEALKTSQPIQFPANVELVKRYYSKIEAVLK